MSELSEELDSTVVGVLLVLVLAAMVYLASQSSSIRRTVPSPEPSPVPGPDCPGPVCPKSGVRHPAFPWFHPFKRGI